MILLIQAVVSGVLEVLVRKNIHKAQPAIPEGLVNDPPQEVHSDSIDAQCIKNTALHAEGAAGPSRVDASGWKRLCTFLAMDHMT